MFSTLTLGLLAAVVAPLQQDTTVADSVVLRGIVVRATRIGESQRLEQPAAFSVVEPASAERSRSVVTADLLRDVPGVHVQQTSAGQGAVVLRGLVGNQVLLLVDGIPLNNGTYRDGPGQYLATIDPETVERIEVVRGPASVLYGSDAQGGVVNIITRPHVFTGTRSARVAGNASSANAGVRGRISGGYLGGNWSLGIGGTLVSAGDLRAGGDLGPQRPTGFHAGGIDAELIYHVGKRHTVKAVAQHFEMSDVPRYDRYVDFRSPEPGRDWEHLFDPQTRQLVYARYTYAQNGSLLSELEATASVAVQREGWSRVRKLDSGEPDEYRTRWRDDVYTPGFTVVGASVIPAGDRVISLTWGGDYYHDRLASEGTEASMVTGEVEQLRRATNAGSVATGRFPDGATADRLGLFVSAESQVHELVRLSLGARWSHFENAANVGTQFGGAVENTTSHLTGQLGVVVSPSRPWNIALRVAEGFRTPNLYDLTNVGPVPGGVALPNVDAEPEHSSSYEIGIRYAHRSAAIDLTMYYTRIRDFIDRAPGTFQGDTLFEGERVFLGQNVGTATIKGVEADAAVREGPFELRGTLLYTRGDQESADGREEPMSKIPPLSGSAGLKWESPIDAIWVEYTLRWAAEQDRLGSRDLRDTRIPDGGTPSFAVHGVRAGLTLVPRINVTAGLENITDELYRNHASGVDSAGRHVWVGLSAVGVL